MKPNDVYVRMDFSIQHLEIYKSLVHFIQYFLFLYDVLTIDYVCYKD